jgi:hypothetical protein
MTKNHVFRTKSTLRAIIQRGVPMMVLSRVPRGGRLQISYSFYNVRPVGVRFTLPKGQLTLLHIDTVNRGNSHKESPDKMLGMYLEHLQDA